MSPNLGPDPHRHTCRFFTEQDVKDGAVCAACSGGGIYREAGREAWWE